MESLIGAAKGNRHGHRDATIILLAFRHGFQATELVALEWSQVEIAPDLAIGDGELGFWKAIDEVFPGAPSATRRSPS